MAADFILEEATDPDGENNLHVGVRVGIRPRLIVALARAWSFSILTYIENPRLWRTEALYNRSVPLYGYLFTIIIIWFFLNKTEEIEEWTFMPGSQ